MNDFQLHPMRRPNRRERKWLAEQQQHFRTHVASLGVDGDRCDPAVLNQVLRKNRSDGRSVEATLVDQLAVAYGNHLLQQSNGVMEWVVVETPKGGEFALRGKASDVMVYVQSTVRHQCSTSEGDFFDALVGVHSSAIEMSRWMAAAEAPRKPWWMFWR